MRPSMTMRAGLRPVFLMQQVDIYATRDRVTWTPRGDQWMLFHEAALK